ISTNKDSPRLFLLIVFLTLGYAIFVSLVADRKRIVFSQLRTPRNRTRIAVVPGSGRSYNTWKIIDRPFRSIFLKSEICGALAWLSTLRYAPNSFDFYLVTVNLTSMFAVVPVLRHGQLNPIAGDSLLSTMVSLTVTMASMSPL
ncbi:hypothetical protein RRG08_067218, partial [Elysia crispata]